MARAVKAPKTAVKAESGSGSTPADKDELLGFYRDMLLIRRFEERAGQLYGMGLIGGFCHLYIGQEAIAVGMERIKEDGDQIITAYRAHGHMLACGIDPRATMAELTARAAGSQGQGRIDAHVRPGPGLLRRARHRRGPGRAGHGPRAR